MSNSVIQASFNAGEWAPALNARVDLAKYHSGAALLRNFFVDYRGGATVRAGTRYILPTRFTTTTRLIPFQASQSVSYVLEFGNAYIRFYNNGTPVLEAATTISGVTNANPGVITDTAHGYSNGDWIQITGVGGTTQLNNNYYIVQGVTTNTYTLTDLYGAAVDTTAFGVYTSGGSAQRILTLSAPYLAAEVAAIKYTQNVNILILTHPNFPPYQLVLDPTNASWTLSTITFGATVSAPATPTVTSTLGAGSVSYAYVVTSVDANGQESGPSAYGAIGGLLDIRTTAGTNVVSWTAVTKAVSYNVYRANPSYAGGISGGADFGFIGNVTSSPFNDSNVIPDFSQGPPVVQNPFSGTGVQTVTVTNQGSGWTFTPTVTFSGGGGSGARAQAFLYAGSAAINYGGAGYKVGDLLTLVGDSSGATFRVTSVGANFGQIGGMAIANSGALSGPLPGGVLSLGSGFPPGTPSYYVKENAGITVGWFLKRISVTSPGTGYSSPPTVGGLSGFGGAAIATIGSSGLGNPTVPGIFQQRLVLAAPVLSPQTIYMSQPGSYYNFNLNSPLEADDAITATLSTGALNSLQSIIAQPYGLIVLADKGTWLINGGTAGSAVSPIQIVANPQVFSGAASQPPPIVAADNVLYVQAKNSIIRAMAFDFYKQIYTGSDISVLSSHLFYGRKVPEWAWAEEPFKVAWAVRDDGIALSLTFLKEQELCAWAHSDTQGLFKSVTTVTEQAHLGVVDAVYFIVQRIINGQTVQYIERMAEQYYSSGAGSAWQVDAGLQYVGPSVMTFSGAQHLANMPVVGLFTDTNGTVSSLNFTMPASGSFTLPLVPPPTQLASVTFDSTTAHNVTLSNGNLTATNTGTTPDQGVMTPATSAQTAGKYYYEMTLTHNVDSGSTIGVSLTSATYTNLNANGTGGATVYALGGTIYTNGTNSSDTIGAMATGDVIGVAVDLQNREIWFKPVAGSQVGTGWNGSPTANPATNVGGVSVLAGGVVPYASFGAAAPTDVTPFSTTLSSTSFIGAPANTRMLFSIPIFTGLGSGNKIKITVQSASTGVVEALTITDAWIGKQDPTTNLWNFDGNQVRLTFGGGNSGVTVPYGGNTAVSDLITFPFDPTSGFIVALYTTTPTDTVAGLTGVSNTTAYVKNGADETSTTTVTGYNPSVSTCMMVSKIEIFGPGAAVPVTWNPNDRTSVVVLSGGNLVATETGSSVDSGVRGTTSRASGKWYFEVACNASMSGSDCTVGITTATQVLNLVGGSSPNAALVYTNTGNIWFNGGNSGKSVGALTGTTACVAVDLDNKRIWVRSGSGNWNGDALANPATNTNGIDISAIFPAAAAYPMATFNNSGAAVTANFAGSFSFTVPSGFQAWATASPTGSVGNAWTANFAGPFAGTTPSGFAAGWPGTLLQPPGYIIVTVGLSYTAQLQTLRLDLGEPTVQGKRKKISAVTVRVKDALGLSIGNTFNTLVAMKDLVLGNVGTMSNTTVTDLVTEDARTIMDPNWTVQGQVCIQQISPYPATVLGVIPEIEVGDTLK